MSPKYASSPDQPERTPAPGVALSGRFLRPAAQVVVVASPDLDPAWISQALTGIARTTIVTSAAEVSGSAGPDARVSLVIASASLCSRTFLDRLSGDGLSGSVLFLAKDEAIDSIVHALATSHALSVVDASLPPDQFAAHVEGLLFPRAETRHARGGLQIEVLTPEGERARFELRDISNRGLSFETESDALKGWLLPGTWLEHVRVFEGDRLLVDGASAAIRHLVPLEQNPGRNEQAKYRVGAELFAPSRNSARERRVITEAIEMLTLLEGARSDGAVIRLGFPYEPAIQWQARIVSVQRDRTSIVVSGRAPRPILLGDVLKFVFEAEGVSYHCVSSVRDVRGVIEASSDSVPQIELRFPRAISVVRRRKSGRFVPNAEQPVLVRVDSAFGQGAVAAAALDLTTAGVSIFINDATDLFPVGTIVPEIELRFPSGTRLLVQGVVRSLTPWSAERGKSRCGVQFLGVAPQDRARIADEIVLCSQPKVRDGTGTNFEELWSFLEECGFLYADKRKSLDETAIRSTFSALLSRPNEVSKTFLCHHEGKLLGHVSVIKSYDATWSIQHLATSSSEGAGAFGRLLNLAVAEYFQQHPEIEWFKLYYRPANKWPDRVFGNFARRLNGDERSDLRVFSYMTRATSGDDFDFDSTGYATRSVRSKDVGYIESCLLQAKRPIDVRAMDLQFPDLSLEHVAREYHHVGLERRREAIVAERNGKIGGFALLEISSPGLNLSELTSSFSMYSLDGDLVALRILAEAATRRYRQLGRRHAICMTDDKFAQRAAKDAGFELKKEYAAWTFHRTVYGQFHKYALKRFG